MSFDLQLEYNTQWGSDPVVNKTIGLGSYGCTEALLIIVGASTNSNTVLTVNDISGCDNTEILYRTFAYSDMSRLAAYRVYYLKNMTASASITLHTYGRVIGIELIKLR